MASQICRMAASVWSCSSFSGIPEIRRLSVRPCCSRSSIFLSNTDFVCFSSWISLSLLSDNFLGFQFSMQFTRNHICKLLTAMVSDLL